MMTMRVSRPLRDVPLIGFRAPWAAFAEGVLSDERCGSLVARIDAGSPTPATINTRYGHVVNTGARNNERVMFDDAALAEELFAATRALLPASLHRGILVGYNERFRGYRYREGQRFAPHFDGAYVRPDGHEASLLSVLFYLNEGFSGGETRLLDYDVTLVPRRGSALFFEHALLHEGSGVTAGTKYVLRTDAMYRFPSAWRTAPGPSRRVDGSQADL